MHLSAAFYVAVSVTMVIWATKLLYIELAFDLQAALSFHHPDAVTKAMYSMYAMFHIS